MSQVIRDAIKLLLAFLGVLFVVFIIVEISVRIIAPQERSMFIADPFIRTIHRKNLSYTKEIREGQEAHIKTNKQGFVGEDFVTQKKDTTYRIAAIGDSFTEAFDVGIENSYPFLLEKALNKQNGGTGYEVYNFGVSGAGSTHELLAYEHYARPYKPDLVLWQVYLGNDLLDDLLLRSDIEQGGTLTKKEARAGYIRAFLSNNFHSPRLFLRELEKIKAIRDLLAGYNIISRNAAHYDKQDTYPFMYDIFNVGEKTAFTDNFSLTCQFVQEFKEKTAEDRANLLVLIIPSVVQVMDEDWNNLFLQFPSMQGKTWDRLQPLKKLKACLEEKEVAYVDMLPILIASLEKGGKRMYYDPNPHFNVYGQQMMAEMLFEKIQKDLLTVDD